MAFLDLARQAVLHRETYTTALKGILSYGAGRIFAHHSVGITPNYLSNLLNPLHDPPSPAVAYRITQALKIEPERKLALLEHMLLAHERRQQMLQQLAPLWREPLLPVLLSELYAANDAANQSGISAQTSWYRVVVEAGQAMLRQFDYSRNLLDYVQVCLVVQDALSVLNQREEALYYAKLATGLMEASNPLKFRREGKRFNYLWINGWYAESIAYRNLNQHRHAFHHSDETIQLIQDMAREQSSFWMPHLLRDQLQALSKLPRFVLSEAEGLADQARQQCETRSHADTESLLLLIDKALIEAYMAYGSRRSIQKALKLLAQLQTGDFSTLSPIKRAVIHAAAARAYHAAGDVEAWREHLRCWIEVSLQAGLTHQLTTARAAFGTAAEAVVAEFTSAPL